MKRRFGLTAVSVALVASCGDGGDGGDALAPAASVAPSALEEAAPSDRAAPSARTARTSDAGAASAAPSSPSPAASPLPAADPVPWLGIATDPMVDLTQSVKWADATVRLPADWASIGISNGMSENDEGVLAYLRAPKDPKREPTLGETKKSAIIILASHGAVHDMLLDYGAGKYLGITGGVSAEWSKPRLATIDDVAVDVLEGKGKIGADKAEVWQVRRKHPTTKGEGHTVLVLAALRLPATDEVRRDFYAALGSLALR